MSGFQPSYYGPDSLAGYDFNQIAGPGAMANTWASMNAAGTNPWATMGVNAGANGFGGTVGMGNIDPSNYGSIAGTDYINNQLGGVTPLSAGQQQLQPPAPSLTPADQAFATQLRSQFAPSQFGQLAMGGQMGPGGYSFARPQGGGLMQLLQALSNGGGGGGGASTNWTGGTATTPSGGTVPRLFPNAKYAWEY